MTSVSTIIYDAYRKSNLLAIGSEPTDAQKEEALRYLSRITRGVLGTEVGEDLTSYPVGREGIERPLNWVNGEDLILRDFYVPKNLRLMFNIEESRDLWLHPEPDDGTRLAVVDVSRNFSQHTVTLHGNGRRIEGATSITLDEDGVNIEWVYSAELGEWLRVTPLEEDGVFPFPFEFDTYFIVELAMALNPSYGIQVDQQALLQHSKTLSALRSRYRQHIFVPSELGLRRPARSSRDRYNAAYWFGSLNPTSAFNTGYPW